MVSYVIEGTAIKLLNPFGGPDSFTTPATAVAYDPVRDLLFLLTSDSLLVLSPAASTGSCP